MAKRKACPMLMDAKYIRRRRMAITVVIGLIAFIVMLLYPKLDSAAESVCVTQLDNKSQWAVQWSKERGQYPYE